MTISKKEAILLELETTLKKIIKGNPVPGFPTILFENTVSYVDRQYINITPNDLDTKEMPWLIINNEGEDFKPHVGGVFENTILVQVVGFVRSSEDSPNLDTLMNSLQRDILMALLNDIQLKKKCSYIMPTGIVTVPEMIYPFGGFVIPLEIVYTFSAVNM